MTEFLKFIDSMRYSFPVHVDISYSRVTNWSIHVYKKGCAEDYPESPHEGDNAILCRVQDCDMEYCFAKALVEVKDWMSKYNGGY